MLALAVARARLYAPVFLKWMMTAKHQQLIKVIWAALKMPAKAVLFKQLKQYRMFKASLPHFMMREAYFCFNSIFNFLWI